MVAAIPVLLGTGCMTRQQAANSVAQRPARPGATNPIATLETELGPIVVELFEDDAPNTVANFVHLAETGVYDGTRFHRVIRGFMMQGGDPSSKSDDKNQWGMGGPGWKIIDETAGSPHRHRAGVLSMANSGPDTGGSQFFIMFAGAPHLDGKHTIFGRVIDGTDVLEKFHAIGADNRRGTEQSKFPQLKSVRVQNKRDHAYEPKKI